MGLAMLLQERGVALYSSDGPSSIFVDYMPERAEHALALIIYGAEAEPMVPAEVSWPRVQARARGDQKSPRWSRDKLGLVYHHLHGWRGTLPNGVEVRHIHGLQSEPVSLGPDAGDRFEHALNFQLWVCDTVPMAREDKSYART